LLIKYKYVVVAVVVAVSAGQGQGVIAHHSGISGMVAARCAKDSM
jgi:hypothetical protein